LEIPCTREIVLCKGITSNTIEGAKVTQRFVPLWAVS